MIKSEDYVYFTTWTSRAASILGPFGSDLSVLQETNCWLGDYQPYSVNGLTGFIVIYARVLR